MIAKISASEGVCLDGKWKGWLFRKHPDGQWVSVRKLEEADHAEGNPLAALFKASTPTIPEGWQLVPKVLTPEMAAELNLTGTFADAAMQVRYAAALAKAPKSPTT